MKSRYHRLSAAHGSTPPHSCQAVLDENRALAAGVGLYIRPHLDAEAEPKPDEVHDLVLPAESSVPQQDEAHPVDAYAPTTIGYLRTTAGQQGVFQIHKAPRPEGTCVQCFSNTDSHESVG